MSDPDASLLERMQSGDGAAFAGLYERHHRRIYRFVLLYTGQEGLAADVTQEVFVALIDNARFDPARGPLEAYLLGMARNLVRRQRRDAARFDTLDADDGSENGLLADVRYEPLRLVGRAQLAEQLRAAILALPAHHREVIILCELEELDYLEAAALLDVPIGTVRSRLNRARKALTRMLAPLADMPMPAVTTEEVYELRTV